MPVGALATGPAWKVKMASWDMDWKWVKANLAPGTKKVPQMSSGGTVGAAAGASAVVGTVELLILATQVLKISNWIAEVLKLRNDERGTHCGGATKASGSLLALNNVNPGQTIHLYRLIKIIATLRPQNQHEAQIGADFYLRQPLWFGLGIISHTALRKSYYFGVSI
jgi:hypothetical protein